MKLDCKYRKYYCPNKCEEEESQGYYESEISEHIKVCPN